MVGMVKHEPQLRREPRGVADGEEPPAPTVLEHLGDAADVGGDDGAPERRGLGDREGEVLEARRHDEDRASAADLVELVRRPRTDPFDPRADRRLRDEPLDGLREAQCSTILLEDAPIGSHQGQRRPRMAAVELAERGEQDVHALRAGEPSDVDDAWRGVWFLSAKSIAWIACAVTLLCFGRGSVALIALVAAAARGWRCFGIWRTPLLFAASVILYNVFAFADAGAPVRGWMVDLSGSVFGEGKGGSLQFCLDHEAILVWNTIRQSPLVGLGGWGANRDLGDLKAIEVLGHNEVITDGLWIIIFSNRGLPGLISVWGWMLAPGIAAVLAIRRVPLSVQPQGVVLGLATWSFLYSFDCLLNAFWTSTQPLLAGAFATFVILCRRYRATPGRETNATARLQTPQRPGSHVAMVKR